MPVQAMTLAIPNIKMRFAVGSKFTVLVVLAIATSFHLHDIASGVLSMAMIVFLAFCGQEKMAKAFGGWYFPIVGIYVAFTYFGIRPPIFSPMHIASAFRSYSVVVAAFALVSSPPGLISAALTRIHCPRSIILGTLVMLRFFPTFRTNRQALRDSMRKRGLLDLNFILKHPYETYEYMLVPSLLALVNSADQLASSAVTRAAEAPMERTSYYEHALNFADYSCMGIFITLATSAIILSGVFA